ncbi:MAG: glycosyltransferase family 2 protein, partial [Armatimonadota bacterium]
MRVSVVIVNWNTRDLLRNCLQTLLQQKKVKTEIIVVDNHSSDGSAAMVRQEFPQVILLSENHNHGYAAGNNLGFTKATGDFIVTLNP